MSCPYLSLSSVGPLMSGGFMWAREMCTTLSSFPTRTLGLDSTRKTPLHSEQNRIFTKKKALQLVGMKYLSCFLPQREAKALIRLSSKMFCCSISQASFLKLISIDSGCAMWQLMNPIQHSLYKDNRERTARHMKNFITQVEAVAFGYSWQIGDQYEPPPEKHSMLE